MGGSGEAGTSGKGQAGADGKKCVPFVEGDKVLAYHGPKLYEAKVQKAEQKKGNKGEWRYFIHYTGWSKTWDEWVNHHRVVECNDSNLAKKSELESDSAAKKAAKNKSKPKDKEKDKEQEGPADVKPEPKEKPEPKPAGKGKKRKQEDKEESDLTVKIPIPPALKKQLVDEWSWVVQDGKLVSLPRAYTVRHVLNKYLEAKTKKEGPGAAALGPESTAELVTGLKAYFDRALPALLLYKQERNQYNNLFPEGSQQAASDVYGAEHLLRLFVKLPELLVHTNMEEKSLNHLCQKMSDFLKFLAKNQSVFLASSYEKQEDKSSR